MNSVDKVHQKDEVKSMTVMISCEAAKMASMRRRRGLWRTIVRSIDWTLATAAYLVALTVLVTSLSAEVRIILYCCKSVTSTNILH